MLGFPRSKLVCAHTQQHLRGVHTYTHIHKPLAVAAQKHPLLSSARVPAVSWAPVSCTGVVVVVVWIPKEGVG